MDKLVYIAAMAAKNTMARQDNVASNLANASTPGFRSQLMAFRSAPVTGPGAPTRAYAVESTPGSDMSPGVAQATGNPLDMAVQGEGWFSIQTARGEGYTRAGNFSLDGNGTLVTASGQPVLGDGGPITVPPDHRITVGSDGTISAIPLNGQQNNVVQVGRLKMVNPNKADMVRSDDGFFRPRNGRPAQADENVRIASGFVEGSNVNAVESMVQMISAARQFETQLKMISTAETNARAANALFSAN